MIICPDCGHENIQGDDQCETCGQALTALSQPEPATRLEANILEDTIGGLDPYEPLVVAADTTVSDVLKKLVSRSVGSAIVMDNGEAVGIFTDRDALLRLNTKAAELGDRPISDFMTPQPQTLDADDHLAFALQRMDAGGYRHIPVTVDGKITGVASVREILGYISRHMAS